LHVLAEGRFLPLADLKANWHSVTGDSYVVDIREVQHSDTAIKYLTKYIAKGVPGSILYNPDLAIEAVNALSGQRTFLCFGTWHGLKLTRNPPDDVWVPIDSLDSLIAASKRGNVVATQLLERLKPNVFPKKSRQIREEPRAP